MTIPYVEQTWTNADPDTPINGERLTHIEHGIATVDTAVATKASTIHAHATADVTSGVFDPDTLGSGTPDATKILYGNSTWALPPSAVVLGTALPIDDGVAAAGTSVNAAHEDHVHSGKVARNPHTASYVLIASDVRTVIEMNVASANTVTIPANVFTDGDEILVRQYGAGVTTIVAGSLTVPHSRGNAMAIAGRYGLAAITFRSALEFYVDGDIA